MKENLRVKTKHYGNKGILALNRALQNRWFYIGTLTFIAFLFISKSWFSSSSMTQKPKAIPISDKHNAVKVSNKPSSFFEMPPDLMLKIDTNLANTFSNLGFIINPNYARKHNISPQIVAAKKRICLDYINRFSGISRKEMEKFGIPASITLAQGLWESNAGESRLAVDNNNHFGIKCFQKNCDANHCSNYTDDTHKDFFMKYASSWESYRAHSLFLQKPRYKGLFKLSKTDYKGWARGLKAAGYATDPKYANKIIRIVEVLKLYQYDK